MEVIYDLLKIKPKIKINVNKTSKIKKTPKCHEASTGLYAFGPTKFVIKYKTRMISF